MPKIVFQISFRKYFKKYFFSGWIYKENYANFVKTNQEYKHIFSIEFCNIVVFL